MSNTWFTREENRMVTFRIAENEKKFVFVLTLKKQQRSMQNVKAIPVEFQHALVVADIDKKKIRNVVRKTCTVRK